MGPGRQKLCRSELILLLLVISQRSGDIFRWVEMTEGLRGGFCLQLHVVFHCRINGTGTSYASAFLNNYIRCDLAKLI